MAATDAIDRELAAVLVPRFSLYEPLSRNFERHQRAGTAEGVIAFLDAVGNEVVR